MFLTKALLTITFIGFVHHQHSVNAIKTTKSVSNFDELNKCEEQLTNYRSFVLQAILNFEDVCEIYSPNLNAQDSLAAFFHKASEGSTAAVLSIPVFLRNFQANEQRADVWTFLKLVMSQFNDIEFATIIHDAVIERCQVKAQREAKRNSVLLGKKQRFHAWGGKRSYPIIPSLSNSGMMEDQLYNDQSYY